MAFFVSNNEELDTLLNPDTLMKADADYYAPRFEAIKNLRDSDDGSLHKGSEFRRVASFTNVPIWLAAQLSDGNLMKDKRRFYALVDKYPQYCTYQRRNGGKGTAKDRLSLPLKALGLDYPGAPETLADFEPVIEEIPRTVESTEVTPAEVIE